MALTGVMTGAMARARDPNTPPNELFHLASVVPEAVLENPVLPLLTLEDPGVLSRASTHALGRLLALPGVPEEWLEILLVHPRWERRRLVMSSPAATPEQLGRLAQDPKMRRWDEVALARNPRTPHCVLEELASRERCWEALVENPALPAELRDALETRDRPGDQRHLARAPHLSPAQARRLSRSANVQVRAALASNPQAPTELLEILAQDPEQRVVRLVAQNPALPLRAAERLTRCPDPEARAAAWALLEAR